MGKKKGSKKPSKSLTQQIVETFQANPTAHWNSQKMGVKQTAARKLIAKKMAELSGKGALEETERGKYRLPEGSNYRKELQGRVDMTQGGSAYVVVEGMPDDIYVDEKNRGTALHGDLVSLQLIRVKKNGSNESAGTGPDRICRYH